MSIGRKLQELEAILGHSFNNKALLEVALSHRSAQKENNERLEFLGDSIVNFIVAEEMYKRYPKATEGELSRLRATLVRGDSLAKVAKELEVGDFLNLGSGELKTGGRRRASILADSLEAIVAAIYLDANLQTATQCVLMWFSERLENISEDSDYKDAKSQLQEFLQARKIALPSYRVANITGEPHAQVFHIECNIKALEKSVTATGSNRRKAEQAAAEKLIAILRAEET